MKAQAAAGFAEDGGEAFGFGCEDGASHLGEAVGAAWFAV